MPRRSLILGDAAHGSDRSAPYRGHGPPVTPVPARAPVGSIDSDDDGALLISWWQMAYGAVLSSAVAAALAGLAARERSPGVIASVAVGAGVGPLAWNAILHTTSSPRFFVDAPLAVFPVSWQDTVSGVFALAATALLLSVGQLRNARAGRAAVLFLLAGVTALAVDVYLY